MIRVLCKQGLVGARTEQFELPADAGITPGDVLAKFDRLVPEGTPIVLTLDGQLLGEADLDEPMRDGQQLLVLPQTAGEVIVFVFWQVVIPLLIATAVSYVAGVLAPRPKPQGVPQDRGDDGSQTYAWDGIATNYGPGLPIPWVYGRHAVGGQVIWTDAEASRAAGQATVDDRLRLVLSLCHGPIHRFGSVAAGSVDRLGGFVGDPMPSTRVPDEIRVNGNLLEVENPFPGAMVWLRPGTHDQAPLPSPFTGVRQTIDVQAPLNEAGSTFTVTFEDPVRISELGFVVAFGQGLYRQTPTGFAGTGFNASAQWRRPGTAWQQIALLQVPFSTLPIFGYHAITVRAGFPGGGTFPPSPSQQVVGPIEVRVVRSTPSAGPAGEQLVNQCIWRSLLVTSPHTLRYPSEALLGLELVAGARFAGGMPQITARLDGARVRVWDETLGWSPRCWDAPAAPWNFSPHPPGRNPAWCLLDFLLARWGLGKWLTEDQLDLPAFRRWAVYCDQDPNPAEPWGEPQFQVDIVGDQPRASWEWVLLFCSTGRASPVIRNGKISIVYHYRDAHSDGTVSVPAKAALQLLTSGNIENLTVNFLARKRRPTVFQFQFLDEELAYAQDVYPVEDDEGSLNNPSVLDKDDYRPEIIQAYGITRRSQLWREGVWRHRIGRLVTREIQFTTGRWALACEVGDVADVEFHYLRPFGDDVPVAMQVLAVVDDDPLTVTVDHHLTGTGLEIVTRDGSGAPVRQNVLAYTNATVSGRKQSVLTVASITGFVVGAPCVVGLAGKLTNPYEIVAISERQDGKRDIRAVEWTPEAYEPLDRDEFIGQLEDADDAEDLDGQLIDVDDGDELPPSVLGIRIMAEGDGTHRISWARPATRTGSWARVYVRPAEIANAWMLVGSTELDEVHVRGLRVGTAFVVSVCLEARRGDPVPPDLGDQVTLTPEEFPPFAPPRVTNARATLLGDALLLEWSNLVPPVVDAVEVRCGSTWASAQVVAIERAPRVVVANPPAGPPFLIAAHAKSGLYGPIVQVTNPNWTPRNQVEAFAENDLAPSPAGAHTDTQWNSTDGVIELAPGALRGTYESLPQDLTTQAPYFWQVRIDRDELEDVTFADLAGLLLGSGEARWRLFAGRPASPADPGLGWHQSYASLAGTLFCDLPRTLLSRGFLGVVGTHTRVLLESRFHISGSWTAYSPHVDRVVVARQIQLRLTFGRRALRYRPRVRQLAYHAFL